MVRRKVQVESGLVDLVAKKEGRTVYIEVKGEDKGGYTSAEMNFQIGLGQIISRMTDGVMHYALAAPVTPHYTRVFRKYRGSVGLSRLGLEIFLVHRNGRVEMHNAESFAKWLETL